MNPFKIYCLVGLAFALNAPSQVTPFNSWRALVIYTDTIQAMYPGHMYRDYFGPLFDGVNLVYENSGVETYAQIAGVIRDKTYKPDYLDGALHVWNLYWGMNGMGRYVTLLDKYGADVLVLVDYSPKPGGAAREFQYWKARGYGGYWTRSPNLISLFAHEMGHVHSIGKFGDGNWDHCDGHRAAFNASGQQRGGPHPDTIPSLIGLTIPGDTGFIIDDLVETAMTNVPSHHGFHTTMAYEDGGSQYCFTTTTHTYDGTQRKFLFGHQGVTGPAQWTGTFSSPYISWVDGVTGLSYGTGYDTIIYLNRLTYKIPPQAGVLQYASTTGYRRDFVSIHNLRADSVRNFKGIPSSVTLASHMSLGANAADTQWVYAHFAATNAVVIEPGFRVGAGSSMRISVQSPGSGLGKRAIRQGGTIKPVRSQDVGINLAYNATSRLVMVSLVSESSMKAHVAVYDMKGVKRMEHVIPNLGSSFRSEAISVRDFPNGVYLVRVSAGKYKAQRQIIKW